MLIFTLIEAFAGVVADVDVGWTLIVHGKAVSRPSLVVLTPVGMA